MTNAFLTTTKATNTWPSYYLEGIVTHLAEVLNPQIEAFFKALGDATKMDGNFLFQGARVVMFRLSEVAGAEVVSLVRKEKEEAKKAAE